MSTNPDAGGQVDTTAVTQGTAAPAEAQAETSISLLAGEGEGKAAEGAAPVEGEAPKAGEPGEGQATEGDKPADGKEEAASKETAPAEYVDFTAPEGIQMDGEVMGDFKSLAKDLGLTQEKAQHVADLGAKLVQKTQEAHAQAIQAEVAKWTETSTSDKEFGGEKLQENLAGARSALDKFGSPELKTMLVESGLGNHPEVIRLLHRVNQAVKEDSIVRGKEGAQTTQSMAQKMYPGMNP